MHPLSYLNLNLNKDTKLTSAEIQISIQLIQLKVHNVKFNGSIHMNRIY
jgi:hypothetical protein